MPKTVKLTGNMYYTPAEGMRDAVISDNVQIAFTQDAIYDLTYSGAVTNQQLSLGTMTAPKVVRIQCTEGACTVKLNAGDTGAISLAMPTTPAVTDASFFVYAIPAGAAINFYVTVAAAAKLSVKIFQ